jgi:hypothetical protein
MHSYQNWWMLCYRRTQITLVVRKIVCQYVYLSDRIHCFGPIILALALEVKSYIPLIKAAPMILGIPHEPQLYNEKCSPDGIGNDCIGGFLLTHQKFIFIFPYLRDS